MSLSQYVLQKVEAKYGTDIRNELKEHWDGEDYDSENIGDDDDGEIVPDDMDNKDDVFEYIKNVVKNRNNEANESKFNMKRIDLNVLKDSLAKYKQQYIENCKCLVPNDKDESLVRLVVIGAQSNYPLMQNLVDAYERTRLYYWNINKKDIYGNYGFNQFAEECKFFSDLRNGNKNHISERIISGCGGFYKRMFTKIQLDRPKKISDDYYTVCDIIIDAIILVNERVSSGQNITPFQFDLSFVATECKEESFNDSKSDDSGDDSDPDNDDMKSDEQKQLNVNGPKKINPLQFSFEQSKMKYTQSNFDLGINALFKRHILKNSKLAHKRFVCVNDLRVKQIFIVSDDDDADFSLKPKQGKRLLYEKFFGLALNKLFPNHWSFKNRKNDDDIPDALKKLPFGVSRKTEWLKKVFSEDNQTVVPKIAVNTLIDKIKDESNIKSMYSLMKKTDKEIKDLLKKYGIKDTCFETFKSELNNLKIMNIGFLTAKHQNSDLITISFHVHKQNEIKAYILWGGQCLRFFPCDLLMVFKKLFTYNKNNKRENKLIKDVSKLFLKDDGFQSFCQETLKKKDVYKDMFPN